MNGACPLSRSAITLSGSRHAQHHQRAAEAIDVRPLPRLARDEILGDDARLGRLAGARDRRRPAAPAPRTSSPRARRRRRLRPASAAPGSGRARGSTNSCSIAAASSKSPRATAAVDDRVDADERRLRDSTRRSVHASSIDAVPQRRVAGASSSRQQLARPSSSPGLQLDLDQRHQQRRIVAGGLAIEISARAPSMSPARDRGSGQDRARPSIVRD